MSHPLSGWVGRAQVCINLQLCAPSLQEIKCIKLVGDKSSSFQVRRNRLKPLKSFRTLEATLWKQTWCPRANIGTYFCGVAIDGDISNEE